MFIEWLTRDAEFWQFWLPQSSLVGGVIMGTLIACTVLLLIKVL